MGKPRVYKQSLRDNHMMMAPTKSVASDLVSNSKSKRVGRQVETQQMNVPSRLVLDLTSTLMENGKENNLLGDKSDISMVESTSKLPRPYGVCTGVNPLKS